MIKAGLDIGKPEDIFSDEGQAIRLRSKQKTKARQMGWVDGRLGIIIDGTGKDVAKISRQKTLLDQIGYETMMIFVNTSLDVALERNQKRPRKLPEPIVVKSWNNVQKNIGKFQNLFRDRFIIVDNNDPNEPPHIEVFKRVKQLANKKVTNGIAKRWIANELEMKKRV